MDPEVNQHPMLAKIRKQMPFEKVAELLLKGNRNATFFEWNGIQHQTQSASELRIYQPMTTKPLFLEISLIFA
jgi:hypothetical protein